jgi:hypothetical protein
MMEILTQRPDPLHFILPGFFCGVGRIAQQNRALSRGLIIGPERVIVAAIREWALVVPFLK